MRTQSVDSRSFSDANQTALPLPPEDVSPIVVVLNSDAAVRSSLTSMLNSSGFNAQTFAAASEMWKSLSFDQPTCLLLDVDLGMKSSLDVQRQLVEREAPASVVFFGGASDGATVIQAFRMGAVDFVDQNATGVELVEVVRRAVRTARDLFLHQGWQSYVDERSARLTHREQEVMQLIMAGHTIKQVAGELEISIQTAAKHRARILQKMGVENDVKLVNLIAAGRHGSKDPGQFDSHT